MTTLYLIRHAKPAASWGEDPDPGLDELGVNQAQRTAEELSGRTAAIKLFTSPLRRCRETASALERRWNASAELFPAVAEIPSPPLSLADRHTWLTAAMAGTWRQLQASAPPNSPDFDAWRSTMLEALLALREPAVIFSHFIAINAIVGAARGSDAVVCFRPDHASVTVVNTDRGSLEVVQLGREAVTSVLTRG
jgi:broad specificity phosphatase PhoE